MVDDGLRAEGADAADRLHDLLLALTGRVDDDAVNSAREMLGIGQVDAAAEFVAGCLLAGRIPVSSTEQYHLRRVLDEARSQQALADRLNVVDSVPPEPHRFSDEHDSVTSDLAEALAPITARLTGLRALWCTWRVTPAGVTYGAVPRRVLLAEVGSDGSAAAVGYQLLEALRRAGIGCSVDVFHTGADLPEYHRTALESAHRVHIDVPAVSTGQNGSNHARAPRRASSGGEPAHAEPARSKSRGGESPPGSEAAASPQEASAVQAAASVTEAASADPESSGDAADTSTERPETEEQGTERSAGKDESGAKNVRVPAAVDAKLTDRERNLLRKLHEELAQREHDRDGPAVPSHAGQDSHSGPKGTGGFPPIQKH